MSVYRADLLISYIVVKYSTLIADEFVYCFSSFHVIFNCRMNWVKSRVKDRDVKKKQKVIRLFATF